MDGKKQKNSPFPTKQAGRLIIQSVNQLFWPVTCINCRENICETDNGLCKNCWNQLLTCTIADYCRRCGRDAGRAAQFEGVCPDCQGKTIHFDRIARAGLYDQSLQRMIVTFKNGKTELDKILGFLADSALEGSGFRDEIELFVPVPLHWSRRLLRGYNQSQILINKLSYPTIKISTDLVRIRRTKTQPTMTSPTARARNVAGAFAVRNGHNFTGRKICLVDDIKTTGATLNECAKTLKNAGAAKVFALVLAVTGQKM
jgi:ComF family protein